MGMKGNEMKKDNFKTMFRIRMVIGAGFDPDPDLDRPKFSFQ
jgi:hypothetical protein